MAKNQNKQKTSAGTNVQHVKQQNQQAAQGQENQAYEFASETDAQEVKRRNQQAEQQKK